MKIAKVNDFWVPQNDLHFNEWQSGKPFTQNKCLLQFIRYCEVKNKKFDCVLDVGAWVGTWSMAMQEFANKIVAFEPDSVHYECLTKNAGSNIETHQLAVGAEQKMISLSEDDFTQSKRVVGEGKIPMITIDSLVLENVDLMKIDVEGFEMEVLKGATKTLESVEYLMIELNNNTKKYGSSNIEIEKYIASLGFKTLISHWPDKVFHRA
jgi:FkbM family methyltransferase|tara:strand:- start:1912 stop:2538 length:627 start_codon:yes stop_codon:yes gene_type:complete